MRCHHATTLDITCYPSRTQHTGTPGSLDTRASPLLPVSMLMSEDLPTFERPMTANSGNRGCGHCATSTQLLRYSAVRTRENAAGGSDACSAALGSEPSSRYGSDTVASALSRVSESACCAAAAQRVTTGSRHMLPHPLRVTGNLLLTAASAWRLLVRVCKPGGGLHTGGGSEEALPAAACADCVKVDSIFTAELSAADGSAQRHLQFAPGLAPPLHIYRPQHVPRLNLPASGMTLT